jgi:hypothetical protein
MTEYEIYVLMQIPRVGSALGFLSFIFIIISGIFYMFYLEEKDLRDPDYVVVNKCKKLSRVLMFTSIVLIVAFIITPDRETIIAMSIIPNIQDSNCVDLVRQMIK